MSTCSELLTAIALLEIYIAYLQKTPD